MYAKLFKIGMYTIRFISAMWLFLDIGLFVSVFKVIWNKSQNAFEAK